MNIIIMNIITALFGIGVSPIMAALIKRFSSEEKILDKNIKNDIKFDAKLALITPLVLIALLFFLGITEKFFIYSFLSIILIIDAFVDMKSQIIPNSLNMLCFIVGIVYAYCKLVFSVNEGIDLLLRNVCWCWNLFAYSSICAYRIQKRRNGFRRC